jgi:hypothetical protein
MGKIPGSLRGGVIRKWLIVLAVGAWVMAVVPVRAEDADVEALRWDCMAMSTIMVGRSLGIPATQSAADNSMRAASEKFAEEQHITQGFARGRMRRAMANFGGPVGVTNECMERGWYVDHAN